jgi:hypothetical protein
MLCALHVHVQYVLYDSQLMQSMCCMCGCAAHQLDRLPPASGVPHYLSTTCMLRRNLMQTQLPLLRAATPS